MQIMKINSIQEFFNIFFSNTVHVKLVILLRNINDLTFLIFTLGA